MAAPGRKFSWTRLITNAVPNFARDDPNDVDLKPEQADRLLIYQLSQPSPRYLGDLAFLEAGIVASSSISKKTHKALLKAGIILPSPASPNTGENVTVLTSRITKSFANQHATISVHAQRKLVGMLFFWEEECTRWKLLDAEEREIRDALVAHPENGDLLIALEAVERKKKLLPSKRGEPTANVSGGEPVEGHALPEYGTS